MRYATVRCATPQRNASGVTEPLVCVCVCVIRLTVTLTLISVAHGMRQWAAALNY